MGFLMSSVRCNMRHDEAVAKPWRRAAGALILHRSIVFRESSGVHRTPALRSIGPRKRNEMRRAPGSRSAWVLLQLTGGCRPNPAFRCLITSRKLRSTGSSAPVRVYGFAAPTAAAPSLPPLTLPAAVVCAASAQRFNYEASCKQFETDGAADDLSWLGAVQYVTTGNNKIAYRRISLGAPPDATPLLLLMG